MDVSRVKYNIGREVTYQGAKYLLTACIMRQGSNGFYFQAELTDLRARSSLLIADLKKVKEQEDNT